MDDLGDPTSYMELEEGLPVFSSDGDQIGTVEHVLADQEEDIFDGLVIEAGGEHRFVDAPQVDSMFEQGVILGIDTESAEHLPEPSPNPEGDDDEEDEDAVDADGEPESDELRDKLKRAWELISERY